MSVRGHAAVEGTAPGTVYADDGAWADGPDDSSSLELTALNDGNEYVYAILDTEENRHHYIAPERVVLLGDWR